MSTNGGNYEVLIEEYAKRHYIKVFKKKYKGSWDVTETAIIQVIRRIDNILGLTDKAEIIYDCKRKSLVKLDFKIAGTKESAKTSGNRAIVFVDHISRTCNVLLIYSKNEICSPNETQKWLNIVKLNFPDIWETFSNR